MTRDNLLFAIIGVLFGFIVGFLFASTMNQRYGPGAPAMALSNGQIPADHPPLGANPDAPASGNMQAEVTAQLEKARSNPTDFDACGHSTRPPQTPKLRHGREGGHPRQASARSNSQQ